MSDLKDFIIKNGLLIQYVGQGGDIIIPNSVMGISRGVFAICYNLTSVVIPKSVMGIGSGAFKHCGSLKSINIQSNVIFIDNEAVFNRMRVAIRKTISNISDSSTLYHDSVTINLTSSTKIRTFDGEESWDVPENTSLEFTVSDSKITFYISGKKITSSKRVIIEDNEEQMKIASISRNSKLLYEGNIELSLVKGRLLVINDLLMDDYLKKVVPSEMVASWHIEALKAQAVAARTFAYKEIYNKSYRTLGYIVDDSESSQVYNN